MSASQPHVVIAGGGAAGLEGVLALRAAVGAAVDITLVEPSPAFTYRPVSTLSPFNATQPDRFATATLAQDAGARWLQAAVEEVQPDARRLILTGRRVLEYDELLVAVGANRVEAVPGALTWRDGRDAAALRAVIEELRSGRGLRIAFTVPSGCAWSLPAYELALLTAHELRERQGVEIGVVTSESRPVEAFGPTPAARVAGLLADAGIQLWTEMHVTDFDGSVAHMSLDVGGSFRCDALVALPHSTGPFLPGLQHDAGGFIPVDHGACARDEGVHVAGDACDWPIKQAGLAAWQADVAAASICTRLGLPAPAPPGPAVLRALLLTGSGRLFLRRPLSAPDGEATTDALWNPPAKIVSGRLASFLALHADFYGESRGGQPDGVSLAGT